MRISGFYTSKGAQLAVKIQAGTEKLRISRIVGGQGTTAVAANKLAAEKQELTAITLKADGTSMVVTATLSTSVATTAYTLNEVGIYATDNAGTEVLYKVYKLDRGVDINSSFNLTIQFTLVDSALEQGNAVVIANVSGMAEYTEVKEMISDVTIQDITKNQKIVCSASQLQAQIDLLPRNLSGDVVFEVSAGTLAGNLEMKGFCGCGSISFVGENAASVIVSGYVAIYESNIRSVSLKNFTLGAGQLFPVTDAEETYATTAAIYAALPQGGLVLTNIHITAAATVVSGCCGVYCNCRDIHIYNIYAPKRNVGIYLKSGCSAKLHTINGRDVEDCSYGIYMCKATSMMSNFNRTDLLMSDSYKIDAVSMWTRCI